MSVCKELVGDERWNRSTRRSACRLIAADFERPDAGDPAISHGEASLSLPITTDRPPDRFFCASRTGIRIKAAIKESERAKKRRRVGKASFDVKTMLALGGVG
ncbi:MAG: hypothetical protein ACLU48_04530 [Clostridiaceae bacterium]